jgi:hypothetical protein
MAFPGAVPQAPRALNRGDEVVPAQVRVISMRWIATLKAQGRLRARSCGRRKLRSSWISHFACDGTSALARMPKISLAFVILVHNGSHESLSFGDHVHDFNARPFCLCRRVNPHTGRATGQQCPIDKRRPARPALTVAKIHDFSNT